MSLRFYQPVGLEEGRGVQAMVCVGDLLGVVPPGQLSGVSAVLGFLGEVVGEGEGQGF